MKPFVLGLLALSLAANAFFLLRRDATRSGLSADARSAAFARENARGSSPAANDLESATTARDDAALLALAPTLETGDPRELVARLRAAGVSTSLIRAIVSARLDEQFAARRAELAAPQPETEWWRNRQRTPSDPRRLAALRELSREQASLLRELLGPEASAESSGRSWQQRNYSHLPPEKIDQLQRIFSDYQDLTSEIHGQAQGILLPEDREKLAFLERERRADLEQLMTPDELEEYDLRTSRSANTLRSRLGGFAATEQEFRALYEAQKNYDDRFRRPPQPQPADWTEQRKTAQQQLNTQFETVLGAERYEEFKQATDAHYQQVNRLVARLELPASTTEHVLAVREDAQQRAAAIRADRSLTPEQRTQQLQQLTKEASAALGQSLGASGLEAYKQYGGSWLRNLPRGRPDRR